MQVYRYGKDLFSIPKKNRAIALGFFDGVHVGHRKILDLTVKASREKPLTPAVFTFVSESSDLKFGGERLYSTEEKLSLIEECGIEEVIIAEFSLLRDMSGEEFVKDFLVDTLSAMVTVSGMDFRFGRGAKYGIEELSSLMADEGGRAIIVPDVEIDEKRASTTYIKELLKKGDVKEANRHLGAPYFIRTFVEEGRGVGHTLGFPTINSPLGVSKNILRRGVYVTEVIISGVSYMALSNVGVCPTFAPRVEHIESYILDFNGDLYGKEVKIVFHAFLRDEIEFSSENDLILQIKVDINKAKEEFLLQ